LPFLKRGEFVKKGVRTGRGGKGAGGKGGGRFGEETKTGRNTKRGRHQGGERLKKTGGKDQKLRLLVRKGGGIEKNGLLECKRKMTEGGNGPLGGVEGELARELAGNKP